MEQLSSEQLEAIQRLPGVLKIGSVNLDRGKGPTYVSLKYESGWVNRGLQSLLKSIGEDVIRRPMLQVSVTCEVCKSDFLVGKVSSTRAKYCSRECSLKGERCRKYGITVEEYDYLLLEQEGRCCICDREGKKKQLSVDHNHKTGRVRGLVCTRCNFSLWWVEKYQDKILKHLGIIS